MLAPLLAARLRRMILLRLLVVALFLTTGAIFLEIPPIVYYGVSCIFLVLSLVCALWTAAKRALVLLAYFQIVSDLFATSLFVYYTGNVDSVLATLYALVIMGAGFLLIPNAALIAAILSCVFFSGTVVLGTFRILDQFLPSGSSAFPINHDWWYVAYMLHIRIIIFLLIGFLASRLVRTIGQMEKQAAISRKFSLLGEMVAHLAHEIKNPLMSISGNIELLGEDLSGKIAADEQNLMDAIVQESQRLKGLLEEVLAYAKPEDFETERADLKCILDEVFLLLEPRFKDGNTIRLDLKFRESSSSFVHCDRNRLKQVFVNIIINAIDAMPDGGVLAVDLQKKKEQIKVSFQDTGVGMSREQVRELFIPFKSSKPQGTGMGLAIAHKIVYAHGGRIEAKSALGRGTVFIVTLPVN